MAFCIEDINVISFPDDDPPGTSCLIASSTNIAIVRGSTFTMVFNLEYNNSPADISSYSVNMSIKNSSNSTTDLLFLSTQNRMISIDYPTARVTVSIPVKHTSRLPLGSSYYLIRLVSSTGNTQKIIQGIAAVSDS